MTLRSEEEVNKMIEQMINRSKGKYITQGVSFNKTCPRQMAMLKMALMSSASFSGLVKEMLALRFDGGKGESKGNHYEYSQPEAPKVKNVGNFI